MTDNPYPSAPAGGTPASSLDFAERARAALIAAMDRLFASLPDHPGVHDRARWLLGDLLELSIATGQDLRSVELLVERWDGGVLTEDLKRRLQAAKDDQDLSLWA